MYLEGRENVLTGERWMAVPVLWYHLSGNWILPWIKNGYLCTNLIFAGPEVWLQKPFQVHQSYLPNPKPLLFIPKSCTYWPEGIKIMNFFPQVPHGIKILPRVFSRTPVFQSSYLDHLSYQKEKERRKGFWVDPIPFIISFVLLYLIHGSNFKMGVRTSLFTSVCLFMCVYVEVQMCGIF